MFDYTPHPTVLAHVEILVQPNLSQKLTWNIHEIDEQALAKFKIEHLVILMSDENEKLGMK